MEEHKEHEKSEHAHHAESESHPEGHKEEHEHKNHEAHESHKEKHEPHEEKESHKEEPKDTSDRKELRDSRISMLVFTLAGIGMGVLSSYLKSSMISNWVTVFAGFLILAVLAFGMSKMSKKKIKAFLGDMFVYLMVWLVTWIFLFNM